MRAIALSLLLASAVAAAAQSSAPMPMNMQMSAAPLPGETLGPVSFSVSCSASVQTQFNRGVALLHDFWYGEAQAQFEQILKADPNCAMAHWGVAMSVYHQIWNRPDARTLQVGWEQIEKAQSPAATTAREQEYIAALGDFYKPGSQDYMARVTAYSAAMGALYKKYPSDVDAGAWYALSLLASVAPNDTSLKNEREALAVLTPLIAKYPDHPGLVHYVIHSCDNPAMAKEGLAAADRYGEIAASGAHADHMGGHIFARLGMWQQDIDAEIASIKASDAAEAHHKDGLSDEPHANDFLMYAYLQSGQDANAKAVLAKIPSLMDRVAAMPDMGGHGPGMREMYLTKLPVFYALETRDWQAATALQPVAGAQPQDAAVTWWAHAIGEGHLHHAEQAQADLTQFDAQMAALRKSTQAYYADSTTVQIERHEVMGWVSFAAGKQDEALEHLRAAADLQDTVGQGEVDIPAREMLADMLLELHKPQQALAEYRVVLKLSPNRFNGLYHAGEAAEEAGDKTAAGEYYAALLKSTGNGAHSSRLELARAKSFVSSDRGAHLGD